MRHLVTFILRLWVEAEADPQGWEGQVEYVATGERMHVRSQAEIVHFVECRMKNDEFDTRRSPFEGDIR